MDDERAAVKRLTVLACAVNTADMDLREVVAAGAQAAADGAAAEAARWKKVEMRLRKETARGEAHLLRMVEQEQVEYLQAIDPLIFYINAYIM